MELPGNEDQLKRFGNAMRVSSNSPEDLIVTRGFEWASLPAGSLVVDVGGGVGNLTMALAKVHEHLRYVIQDRAAVAKEGEQLWKANMPGFIESGIVQLQGRFCYLSVLLRSQRNVFTQGHDFFAEQPIRNADIFFLRFVVHNWSDKYATKILSNLRAAAQPTTKLVIFEAIMDHMSRDQGAASDIPGASKPQAPEPLLPYADSATSWIYAADICVRASFRISSSYVTYPLLADDVPVILRCPYHRLGGRQSIT